MTKIKTDIVNGHKVKRYTNEEKSENYEECKAWLKENLILVKKINSNFSSYWIKYIVSKQIGAKVSHYDVKIAMCELDIKGIEEYPECINYYYPISQKFFKTYNTHDSL